MKKLLSMLLAVALLLSCCAITAVADEDRPTISYWVLFTHVAGNDSYVEKYIEDKLGIDLGDVNVEQLRDQLYITDKGISRDVFTEIATRFVNDDPDGNGVADTYGIVDEWTRLMTSFGLTTTVMEYEGKAIQWYVHPKCKDFLMYMNSLYEAGLLHPELFTLQWGMNWEILKAGQAGIMLSGSTHYLNAWCSGRWPYAPLNGESEAQVILMVPGVTDEEGNNVCPFYIGRGFNSGNGVFWVNADTDDEKMAVCIRFYDYIYNQEDIDKLATIYYGEEGVDWVWDDAKTMPIMLNTLPMGEKGAGMFDLPVQIGKRWQISIFQPDFKLGAKYYIKSEGGIWNKDLVVDYKKDMFNETQAGTISNEYSADWTQIRDKYFQGVIMGEKNVDADWDAYIADLNAAHFGEYLDELDKAPVVADMVAEYDSKY